MLSSALLLVALAACTPSNNTPTSSKTAPNAPESTMTEPTEDPNEAAAATCTTEAQARASMGTVCTVVGTYELRDFTTKKGDVFRTWPVVVLEDGATVALESLWDVSKMPTPEELARWRGQRVEATGTLYGEPPADERMANFSQMTISPVQSLALAP